jgi:hypothetical protein
MEAILSSGLELAALCFGPLGLQKFVGAPVIEHILAARSTRVKECNGKVAVSVVHQ